MRSMDAVAVQTITLAPQEAEIIHATVSDLAQRLPAMGEAELLDELHARAVGQRERLPRLMASLEGLAEHRGAKVLLIDTQGHARCDDPTPVRHLTPADCNLFVPDLLRGFVLGLAGLYGYGFTTQQQGLIHNNIIPVQEHAQTVGHNASSAVDLALHTEVASYNLGPQRDISPDFVTLHFYRNQPIVPTLVAIPEWHELPAAVLEVLRQPWFFNQTSPAQGGQRNNAEQPVSVLYGPEDDPWIRLATSQLHARRYADDQRAALSTFVDHLNERAVELPTGAGMIVLMDNRRTLHGRPAHAPAQAPRYDGTDRWQRRITASSDPARIRAFEAAPRVVDVPRFLQQATCREMACA